MILIRSASAICVIAATLSLGVSCSAAPNTQAVERIPVAVSQDGQPIFQLSEDDLIDVFRDVQVDYKDAYPPVSETLHEGGRYSAAAAGDSLQEGRFWVANGELCARVEGQTGETLCRRFGRSPDGAVHEISGSRGTLPIPRKYELKPIPSGAHQ